MNLSDAVKSGRRFRKKGTEHWIEQHKGVGPATFRKFIPAVGSSQYCCTADDFTHDEWEIEPIPVPPEPKLSGLKKPSALKRIAAALESIEGMMKNKKTG